MPRSWVIHALAPSVTRPASSEGLPAATVTAACFPVAPLALVFHEDAHRDVRGRCDEAYEVHGVSLSALRVRLDAFHIAEGMPSLPK